MTLSYYCYIICQPYVLTLFQTCNSYVTCFFLLLFWRIKDQRVTPGVNWQEWGGNSWIHTRTSTLKGATNELTEIMSDNESYPSKQSHIMCSIRCLEVSSPQQSAAVTQQGSWSGGGAGAVLVATKFFNFTVNFLGNYWRFWWTFYGTSSPPVRRCTCLAAKRRGSSSHFWHQFPPPISGPCHHWWPLWRSLNRTSLVSEASCTLSAPLGWRWVDWTMTSLCVCVVVVVCVCVCVCVCLGLRAKFGKAQQKCFTWTEF